MLFHIACLVLRRLAIAAPALLVCLAAPAAELSAELPCSTPPRYRLKPGQEWIYRVTASEEIGESGEKQTGTPREESQWHVTVVHENDDGSWRLFIRTEQAFLNADGSVRRKSDSFDYCDLRPDGSYSLNEQTAIFKMLFPYELFCRLPDTPAEADGEWSYQPPAYGIELKYRVEKTDGPEWEITAIQKDDYSDGGWQLVRRYEFDPALGMAKTIVRESIELKSGKPKHRRTVSLMDETQNDAAWTARFYEDGKRYLDANAKWMALCYQGIRSRNVDDCRMARTTARAVLAAGRQQAEMDYFKDLYDANLEAHDKEDNGHLDVVKTRERFFAAAPSFSTSWQTKALDGSTFRLADQRGKVVVLYFWSEGCEYCMLAAPQISKLAADYKARDVTVVGMFVGNVPTDDDGAAPRHAGTKAYRGFPHLEAKQIYDSYQLQRYGFGTPSTLVLDQQGKICEAWSGYSADLGQCLRTAVDRLRGEGEAAVIEFSND
ncbi:MAG TPA: TlpA disulfide reductase family protein [Pirellulales bacterium]